MKCRKSSKQWSNVEWNQSVERKKEEEILHYDKERDERRVDARAGGKGKEKERERKLINPHTRCYRKWYRTGKQRHRSS